MSIMSPSEISISFTPNSSELHREEEMILMVPISGGSLFNFSLQEEDLDTLIRNLEDAFSFLAEDGIVEIEFKM